MEDELKELKSVLRSLVVSSPTQVDVPTLLRDYRSMVGKPLPLKKYGYENPVQFLKERFSDCFLFQGPAYNPVLTLIVPDTLKHIDKFVQKQKIPSTLKHKVKRRSIPVANTSLQTNLISETFIQRQKEIKTETNIREERREEPIENKPKKETPNKTNIENNSQSPQNGMCSKTALENFMRKRIPLYKSSEFLDTEINSNERDSSKDDPDSGRHTSSSNGSAKWMQLEELKTEIKNLLEDHPEGVWCTDLIELYRERYGRELNCTHFGYTSVLSLVCVLEDGLSILRPEGSCDWKLFASTSSKPTSAFAIQPSFAPLAASVRRSRDTATVDPDDALPGIAFDTDVFPADCMHYMESIPRIELPEESAIEVQVGELYSPSHFWLMRLGDDYNIAMEDLMDEMNEYYCRGEGRDRQLFLGAVRVGHYCTSCFEGDWHRSLIVRVLDSDTVKVRHVDYGTVEQCAVASLRPLLRRWGALPQQAIRARLAGVRPPCAGRRWPRASAAHLLHQITDRRLVAQIVSRSADAVLEVVLVDTSTEEDVCINTELVRSGHADARPDSCLGTSECYLYPSFEALECGDTPNYAEIHAYLRDGIALDFVEDYRRHVPSCLPSPPVSPTPLPSPISSPLSSPEALAFFESPVPLFPPVPPLRHPAQPPSVPLLPVTSQNPSPPRPLTSLDSLPPWSLASQDHSLPRPTRPMMSHDPSPPWHMTSHNPLPPRPTRPVTSLDPLPPRPTRPVTSHDPSPPWPVTSLNPSPPWPVTSHDRSPPWSVTSHDPSSPWPVTSLNPSPPWPVTSHDRLPHQPVASHDPKSPRPQRVTLSTSDCDVFYLLSCVDLNAAHRFMMGAIGQAMATPANANLNPEAEEFRMIPARTHTEQSVRHVTPASIPFSGYGTTPTYSPVNPAVRRFPDTAQNLQQQHQPISGTRPPPGFENFLNRI